MQLQLGGFKKIAASIRSATFVMLLAHVAAPAVAQVRSDAASPDVVAYTHKYALVIGIDKYEDRLWGNLNYPVDDAERIATALEKEHGFEKPIIARNLKSDDFKRVLEQFFAKTGSEDGALLLLWFAGHGALLKQPHAPAKDGYLVPADAPKPSFVGTDAKAQSVIADFRAKAVSMDRLKTYVDQAQSRHILVVLDSCFSGSIFKKKGSDDVPREVRSNMTNPVRRFISSGRADVTVDDSPIFRKLFLEALSGAAAKDGYVTGFELHRYLERTVYDRTKQQPMTDTYGAGGNDEGDVVFKVKPKKTTWFPTPVPNGKLPDQPLEAPDLEGLVAACLDEKSSIKVRKELALPWARKLIALVGTRKVQYVANSALKSNPKVPHGVSGFRHDDDGRIVISFEENDGRMILVPVKDTAATMPHETTVLLRGAFNQTGGDGCVEVRFDTATQRGKGQFTSVPRKSLWSYLPFKNRIPIELEVAPKTK
jgi:hypothetical protein